MKFAVTANVALHAAIKATRYADLVTDHDPDDGDHVVPGELRRFLGRLRLLHGVPFSYLVPDAGLLPLESIRFFHLDRAWTDALVQGALSVGTITSADRAQLEAVYPHIRNEVDEAERNIRRPTDEKLLKAAGGAITGFVMRSRLVSGWPNLHVRAYSVDTMPDNQLTTLAESSPHRMKVLRMERLAPSVLLVLFDGVPAVVHVEEPRQGLQFGVRTTTTPQGGSQARVHVRDCANGDSVPPLENLVPGNSVAVPFRANAPGVINLAELRRRLVAHPGSNAGGALEPNEFALQMLRFPFRQVFGDPDNQQQQRFYPLDRFKVTVALDTWKTTLLTQLDGGPR
jgi:hypothetical protein